MATFNDFKKALEKQIKAMEETGLYVVDVAKDVVWDTYLNSFPEGTNKLYKERREYDCNCCKQFVRNIGNVVTIKNNKLVSVWDIQVGGYYQPVVDSLSALVKTKGVVDKFLHFEQNVGIARNNQLLEDGKVKTWDHFHAVLDKNYVMSSDKIPTRLGEVRSNKDVLLRSLQEMTLESAEIVLELIAQNSLYRGQEHKAVVKKFVAVKKEFDKVPDEEKDNYVWVKSAELGGSSKMRNTVIGTLLSDLSEGVELEKAVKSFEAKVAPTNYKRPTALVTKSMIESAQKEVEALGITDSLARRYAVAEDLTINNVLFADRSVKKAMNVFDDLVATTKVSEKSLGKVEEISAEDFVANILPKASSLEVLVENKHTSNLVSLIAPQHADAPELFKWGNGFSWSYNGEVTDSIKERVKAAGGKVDGALRVSLSWHNSDDLDLHMYGPKNSHIYFGARRANGAYLDLDMNGMDKHDAQTPVENIIWGEENNIDEGTYRIVVNQWAKRMNDREGFSVELEFKGQVFTFEYPQAHRSGNVDVLTFTYSRAKGVEIVKSIGHTKQSKEVWGIPTETFQKVAMVMNSPNHWDGEQTGNKHVFFMLDKCKNPEDTRGFYNEYLKEELSKHRKVFEVLGGKLKAAYSDNQLSGVGFSTTQRNSVFVKVSGAFNRTLKVNF